MKKFIGFVAFLFLSLYGYSMQLAPQKQKPKPFDKGEKITYKIKYSLGFRFPVGEVVFEIAPEVTEISGTKCLHFSATGRTYGFYDAFFKVRDKYEAYVDSNTILPLMTFRNVHEGGFKFQENLVFFQEKNMVKTPKAIKKIPNKTMDILTVLYYSRTLNLSNAKEGDKFMFTTFIDDSAYAVGLKVVGRETIKASAGKFNCLKLSPILVKGRLFKSEEDMILYVTDDENHIPVKVQSDISVGSIKVELEDYKNLKYPLTSKL